MNFKKWMEQSTVGTETVDQRQINAIYDKTKYSVKIVQIYDQMTGQRLLTNISTIVPLSSGAYGLYNSSENKKIIGTQAVNKIRFKFGDEIIRSQKINQIPNSVLKKYIPDLDLKQVQPSDVRKTLTQKIPQLATIK